MREVAMAARLVDEADRELANGERLWMLVVEAALTIGLLLISARGSGSEAGVVVAVVAKVLVD